MKKTTNKQKFLLITASLIFAIISLELILRLGGNIFFFMQERRNKIKLNKASTYVVLCIGESMTAFGGDNSYPSQLQTILNESSKKEFKVINKGFPGINSDAILTKYVEDWLDIYKPNIVVAMLGINDDTNQLSPLKKKTLKRQAVLFIKNCRVYKLVDLIAQHLTSKREQKFEMVKGTAQPKQEKSNQQLILDKIGETPPYYRKIYHAAIIYEGTGQPDAAEAAYRKLIDINIDEHLNLVMYKRLGNLLRKQEKYKEFAGIMKNIPSNAWGDDKWIKQLCKEEETFKKIEGTLLQLSLERPIEFKLLDILGSCYAEFGDTEEAEMYFDKVNKLRASNVNITTQKSYLQLLELLKKRNIIGVFTQYPNRDLAYLKDLFPPHADLRSIIFVENKKEFEEALSKEKYNDYFNDRFAGNFGHCTKKGNNIIAQNIANAILKEF